MSEVLDESVVSESEKSVEPSKEDILNFLIAIGVNSCNRSYENHHKEMKELFLNMPLRDISLTWEHLDDQVKIAVVNAHLDEFKEWISSN